jgi:hypothetical protein
VFGRRRRHPPIGASADETGADVAHARRGRWARQRAATVDVDLLAQRRVDARPPVEAECALLADQPLRDRLGRRQTEDAQRLLRADALVPTAEQKAGVVDIVVEVMVGKEKEVDLCGRKPRSYELLRRRRRWCPRTQDVSCRHGPIPRPLPEREGVTDLSPGPFPSGKGRRAEYYIHGAYVELVATSPARLFSLVTCRAFYPWRQRSYRAALSQEPILANA